MPRYWLLALTGLVACGGAEFTQQKLEDGSVKVTCELEMDDCVRRAKELCSNQRFRILEGVSETRLRDAPPFERAYHTSRLHLKCTTDGSDPLLSLSGAAPVASSLTPAPAPSASRVCTLGETRACVGPGACQGGQICLSDGTGFGSCDCGPAPTPAPAPAPPPSAAPTDAPATPAPPAPTLAPAR